MRKIGRRKGSRNTVAYPTKGGYLLTPMGADISREHDKFALPARSSKGGSPSIKQDRGCDHRRPPFPLRSMLHKSLKVSEILFRHRAPSERYATNGDTEPPSVVSTKCLTGPRGSE